MQKGKVISTEPTFHYVVGNFNPITACFGNENNVIISAYSSSAAFRGQVMGGGLYNKDESVTIQAVPASGYALDCWTINGEKSENTSDTLTVTANTDAEYVAAFVPKKSNISTMASRQYLSADAEATINVAKSRAESISIQDSSTTYKGSPVSILCKVYGASTYETFYEGIGGTKYEKSSLPPTDAGTYEITAVCRNTNYVATVEFARGVQTVVKTK